MHKGCILLNGDYTVLGLIDWKKAMGLLVAEKIKVLKYSKRKIRSVGRTFLMPAVAVLVKVVRIVYRHHVPFSRRNVLIRDQFTCVYCGSREPPITVDHVFPRSLGGKSNFDNCVACCRACNTKKGAHLPREAGMALRHQPWQPTISEFMRIRLRQSGVLGLLAELGLSADSR
ncbi:HNH endonuclease [Desulfosarcina variabilis str. Montpellier]|uniref:HNH endonuclease n=1 Tax=Desulfosarcina variabilis TaxID=2300 RepID=UPI003AFB29B7